MTKALVDSQTRVVCLLSGVLISFSVLFLHFAFAKPVTLALVLFALIRNIQRVSSEDQEQARSLMLLASPLC
jgi:hypothetical protein